MDTTNCELDERQSLCGGCPNCIAPPRCEECHEPIEAGQARKVDGLTFCAACEPCAACDGEGRVPLDPRNRFTTCATLPCRDCKTTGRAKTKAAA